MCRYDEYVKWKDNKGSSSIKGGNIATYFAASGDNKYAWNHPRQKALSGAIIEDLIVELNLPPHMVETEHFRHIMSVVDPRHTPAAHSTVTARLDKEYEKKKAVIE